MQNYSLMFLLYLVMAMLRPTTTTQTMINEVFSIYNEVPSLINQGRGYHYGPPYLTNDIKSLQQQLYHQQCHNQQHQQQYQQFNGISYDTDDCTLSYHSPQDQHHTNPVSNSAMKSPLIYLYMLKQYDVKTPKENVPFTSTLQMSLISRASNIKRPSVLTTINSTPTIISTAHQIKPAATTTTLSTLRRYPLDPSSKSKNKYSSRKYVNLKLPLHYDKLPLNVPQLPLQSGASYASLAKGVTSYDLPLHPL